MTHSERLSARDGMFLQVEWPTHPLQILALFVFEGPAPSFDEFFATIASRIGSVPQFRQRVLSVPLGLGRPVWADDPSFDLARHVRSVRVPGADDSLRELSELTSPWFAEPLDKTRPLWELWFIEGLADGGFAVAGKAHHSFVDGVAFYSVFGKLLNDREHQTHGGAPWRPRPEPSALRLAAEALRDAVAKPVAAAASLVQDEGVVESIKTIGSEAKAARRIMGIHGTAPDTRFNVGPYGKDRRTDWIRVRGDDLLRTRGAFKTTINTIFVAAVTGGLRRYFARHGDDLDGVVAMVPMSVRSTGDSVAGNRVRSIFPRLPLDEPDPASRVRRIADDVARLREPGPPTGSRALQAVLELSPPRVQARRGERHYSSRTFNLLVTNVPGPRPPFTVCGRRMVDTLAHVHVTPYHGVSIVLVSYEDRFVLGVTTDVERVPDGAVLAADIASAFDELVAIASGPAAVREQAAG